MTLLFHLLLLEFPLQRTSKRNNFDCHVFIRDDIVPISVFVFHRYKRCKFTNLTVNN